jgi:hypothetical protein
MSVADLTLDNPHAVLARLEEIERDLAYRQNVYESAARNWFLAKRDLERERAIELLANQGTVAERQAHADRATSTIGATERAEYEAIKAVVDVLSHRASILQSVLKAHGRA